MSGGTASAGTATIVTGERKRASGLGHASQGTDSVHPWLSNGDGTFAVGSFHPGANYAMSNGLWLTGDFNGDGQSDLAVSSRSPRGQCAHTTVPKVAETRPE